MSVSQLYTGYVLILLPKTNRYTPDPSEMCSIDVFCYYNGHVHLAGQFFPSMHRLLTNTAFQGYKIHSYAYTYWIVFILV